MSYEELDDAAATVYEGIRGGSGPSGANQRADAATQREIAGDLGIGLSTLVRWIGWSRDRRAADPARRQRAMSPRS